jgi:uncharacterized protein (TIGR03435 family)
MTGATTRTFLASAFLFAAASSAQTLKFEVAAIKPAAPQAVHVGTTIDGTRLDMGFFSLTALIVTAYKVEGYQIKGPDWMATTRFDILARMPEGATKEQVPEMLQALLAERFKLAIRHESREQQVYALVAGKDGPKLKETPADFVVGSGPVESGRGNRAIRAVIQPLPPGGWQTISFVDGRNLYESKKLSMAEFARFLRRYTDTPVVDLTGLSGFYELALEVPPTAANRPRRPEALAPADGSPRPAEEASDPAGVSIFTSIQKLGLRLEKRKMALDQLVVEHIEKTPTEN